MWFLGQNWSQNCQNVFKKDVFLGDFGIFYEMRKKIKEKSFSHILDNIVIVQVKKIISETWAKFGAKIAIEDCQKM